ncbi:MAG: hypoxanthine phosphoribosyltransferase [Bacteroidales bacterium]|nr:hypoxanthine phosphoribosyltransferase [Bacteroidales bacterium]MDD3430445.1 hypoxanthine phosphoribosyltransferase [Bacteroidales bacterium]MDD4361635.1 hypoxanthine phosphoribosyltransferase [Bacteroidales bacterium]MDD4430231.1 hypoxanthine phosphoribosyltransferase [Bacteroidales bacterium]
MKTVQVKDRSFTLLITAEQIRKRVSELAREINRDMEGKNPLFLVMLNGAFMFAADLLKEISIPCEISFVKYASYCGVESSGRLNKLIGLKESLRDRCVVILEDIVDSGLTMSQLLEELKTKKTAELYVATCAFKPEAIKTDFKPDYIGFCIPDVFLVGYGLDYGGYGRNLEAIYELKSH